MWVVLVVDILNKEFSNGRIFAVKRRLQEIPEKLSDLFRDILYCAWVCEAESIALGLEGVVDVCER